MQVEGLILAGGKSSRMGGRHKGSLMYREETFVQRLIRELQQGTKQIWLSYGCDRHETYAECSILTDIYPDCGPIGGIHAGLSACGCEWMLVAACDMPFLKIELFRYLWKELEQAESEEYAGAVPVVKGRIHPLAAIYRKRIAGILEKQIVTGSLRLRDALGRMKILYVDVSDIREYAEMLRNINTIEEYEELTGRE